MALKNIIKFIYSSKFMLPLALILDVGLLCVAVIFLGSISLLINLGVGALVVAFVALHSRFKERNRALILASVTFPLFGLCLYFYLALPKGGKRRLRAWQNIRFKSSAELKSNQTVVDELTAKKPYQGRLSNYVLSLTNMPLYQNTNTKFFGDGEAYFEALLEELKKAERYIFIESYILENSELWNKIFDILKIKARQGVEVKILYDDGACLNSFEDSKTFKKLENYRIESTAFNKISVLSGAFANSRNKCKMFVIDGKVALTSGLNIGDFFIKYKQTYGSWKDAGLMLNGEAVWSMVVNFLGDYQFASGKQIDISQYKTTLATKRKSQEYIQPFSVGPFASENLSQDILLGAIEGAQKSVYITTPNLVLDTESFNALKRLAKSGVDVKIIYPSIHTNGMSHLLALEGFAELIRAGVKIFEYSPGYVHEKYIVVDGESVIFGNMNLDFRKTRAHFENGIIIHGGHTVEDMRFDFERTLNSCRMLTVKDMRSRKWINKIVSKILKFFAPIA